MTIQTIDKRNFELLNENGAKQAQLAYSSSSFSNALVETDAVFILKLIATGTWITVFKEGKLENTKATIRVEAGGIMTLRFFYKRKKYLFKKSVNWKLRFSLCNKEGEEILSILPSVNWQKESHDFVLQLNDEFEKECDSFLILQALHCANCSLSMMIGGQVPALVSL